MVASAVSIMLTARAERQERREWPLCILAVIAERSIV
jgi:hypothetical protein